MFIVGLIFPLSEPGFAGLPDFQDYPHQNLFQKRT